MEGLALPTQRSPRLAQPPRLRHRCPPPARPAKAHRKAWCALRDPIHKSSAERSNTLRCTNRKWLWGCMEHLAKVHAGDWQPRV